ncbi:hypothetical protein [Sphingomonas baiyangensis]|uniref:Uncharacterized protein n=1 Tax=Sphingomonas baiyangensis TaxID=2572576 RepID=A0A4U1L4G3_9SPHN|nr:hypothetical protein [Sphingomonas baiyangensis]TKD51811.1 hypothetical protein FBR43_14405 [Sphingomonas baiyangensis]
MATFDGGLLAVAIALAAPIPDDAATRFDTLKALAGTWRRADAPASPLSIRFSTTAGGTVLVEEWLRGDQPHSMTLYHRDGAALIATHYCPQGNQPRLAMVPGAADAPLHFALRDATDLDAMRESHLVALSFAQGADGVLVRAETYRQGGADEASELRLTRVR